MARTAKNVIAKIVAMFNADWQGQWEIQTVRDREHDGQELVIRNTTEEADFVITAYRRSTSEPIEAKVAPAVILVDEPLPEPVKDYAAMTDEELEADAEADDDNQDPPF